VGRALRYHTAMRLRLDRIETVVDGATVSAPIPVPGAYALGPLVVDVAPTATGFAWGFGSQASAAVRVRSVTLVFSVEGAREPLRMLRHGWQSWSASGVATLGVDRDPAHAVGLPLPRDLYHADPAVPATPEELRSEWVTVLADATPDAAPLLVGFDAGTSHDGTLRLRRGAPGVALRAEAFLGDVVLAPGARRALHDVIVDDRPDPGIGAVERLEAWADRAGRRSGARVAGPRRTGWCSWYQYFHDVTEADLRANLARAADWPLELIQLDDGFQRTIGDWLDTNPRFPSGVGGVAAAIAAAGRVPGLWLAPFLVAPDSAVARDHPAWLARGAEADDPLVGMFNPPWGGGRDGWMWVLDTTNPEVLAHLAQVARALADMGFRHLKLDFAYAPALAGRFADPGRTPAERVRLGLDAIRRGAGEDVFLLGCGMPLAPAVGVVDGMRIGPDVAPWWALPPARAMVPGHGDCEPATRNAFRNTLVRAFMHRRLWLNDPDCVMLRQAHTALDATAARGWALTVGVSGGLLLLSDDLALLDDAARAIFDEADAIGRASDAAARADRTPRCPDLLEHDPPTRLAGAGWRLAADPDTGAVARSPG